MSRIRTKDIRKLSRKEMLERVQSYRTELTKLRVDQARGTLRKENGKIKIMRRDIARILTCLRELKE